jgi:hypothetical protein
LGLEVCAVLLCCGKNTHKGVQITCIRSLYTAFS